MVQTDQDDEMYAGNKRVLRYTVLDEDNGNIAFDLSSYTIKWAISRLDQNGNFLTTPVLEKHSTVPGEITVSGADNNIASVLLVGADTDDLSGDFYIELEVFDVSLESVVVATGKLTINRNVVNT